MSLYRVSGRQPALVRSGCIAAVLLASACRSGPPGTRWVLPDGFQGCVEVEYEVPGAPALPEEQGFQLVVVPATAVPTPDSDARAVMWKQATSSAPRLGEWQRTEVYAVKDGKLHRVEPEMGGSTRGAADAMGKLKRLPSGGTMVARTCFKLPKASSR